ncbi:MAG: helix-turn-helix transcriptional regulator [Legionellaceae bacterium]|nr:helix-turn-helix transcriptional regulator [Legionellaceae bacterium]
MKNRRSLDEFLKNGRRLPELDNSFHTVYFKDICGKYLAANDTMLHIFQLNQHQQLLQYQDNELISDAGTAERVTQNDICTRKRQQTLVFTEYGIIGQTPFTCLSVKTPLFDEQRMTGLFGISLYMMNDIRYADFFSISRLMQSYFEEPLALSQAQSSAVQRPRLTTQEQHCLRLYIHGYSANQIAHHLVLSKRTIESYLINIKNKLAVTKRHELISKSLYLFPELLRQEAPAVSTA